MTDPVDRLLDTVEEESDRLGRALSRLAKDLIEGAGRPYSHEMTPAQSRRLAETLERVGRLGGLILQADVLLTAAREGVQLREPEEPLPN